MPIAHTSTVAPGARAQVRYKISAYPIKEGKQVIVDTYSGHSLEPWAVVGTKSAIRMCVSVSTWWARRFFRLILCI